MKWSNIEFVIILVLVAIVVIVILTVLGPAVEKIWENWLQTFGQFLEV